MKPTMSDPQELSQFTLERRNLSFTCLGECLYRIGKNGTLDILL
jgi:hypothetical protein